jgi:hypothetical protein
MLLCATPLHAAAVRQARRADKARTTAPQTGNAALHRAAKPRPHPQPYMVPHGSSNARATRRVSSGAPCEPIVTLSAPLSWLEWTTARNATAAARLEHPSASDRIGSDQMGGDPPRLQLGERRVLRRKLAADVVAPYIPARGPAKHARQTKRARAHHKAVLTSAESHKPASTTTERRDIRKPLRAPHQHRIRSDRGQRTKTAG